MAAVDGSNRHRDTLPSIHNLDFDKSRQEKPEHSRFSATTGLGVSTGSLGSPTAMYAGPPPPYSSAPSLPGSIQGLSGYISPPESNSRRSTRDEKESPIGEKSLPSLSEALKHADMPQPPPALLPANPTSNPSQNFAEAPKGPGNPFSQSSLPSSALRSSLSSNSGLPEPLSSKTVPPPPAPSETRPSHPFGSMPSPRSAAPPPRPTLLNGPIEPPTFRSPFEQDAPRSSYSYNDYPSQAAQQQPLNSFQFDSRGKYEERQNPFTKPNPLPYNETVKRHLDVFDAELALNEIGEASNRTLDFSKVWSARNHQSNRSFYAEGLPGTAEVDEMLRHAHRIIDSLNHLREVAVVQQNTINEQRARAARLEDDYAGVNDEYKAGGFAGGDAKKRRGKAAPPGRCHSCNRAETPEWRRGPDGARTLCNACGLHYAKLTRKMGANKSAMTTSNLRPKA